MHMCLCSIRRCRREGTVGIYVSVHVNDAMRCVHVACDGGRICRPLIVVEHGVPKLTVCASTINCVMCLCFHYNTDHRVT